MGKQNTEVRNWLQKKERYADLFNAACCDGKQVFCAENLEKMDVEQDAVLEDGDGNEIIVQRFRDLKMKSHQDMKLIIIASEMQSEVHYAMPVRSMLYDALDYMEQVKRIGEKNKSNKNYKKPAEFLSGMRKEDRLVPVLTLCLYLGDDEWDGRRDLHGMLEMDNEMYVELQKYIPNYHINLVDAKELAKGNRLKTDLQIIFGMLECKKDKTKLTQYINSHRDYFENVDTDAYYAAKALLGAERPLKEVRRKGEKIDMCKALEDLYQEGREDKVKEQIRKKLVKGKTPEEIAEALEEDVEVIERLIGEMKV